MPSSPVTMDSHAAATLRYIRESMDSARTLAVPGSAGMAVGLVGLAVAILALLPGLRAFWLPLWVTAAPLAATIGAVLVVRRATVRGFNSLGVPGRKVLLCLLPGLLAGAVLTLVEWQANRLHDIPATWLLLYGCALASTSATTCQALAVLGGLFGLLGLVAFYVPATMQAILLGVGFGGLHVGFGVYMKRQDRGHET